MQITEQDLFAMYGKAVAENVVLRGQLNALGAELQAANPRIEQLEGVLSQAAEKPTPRRRGSRKPKAAAGAEAHCEKAGEALEAAGKGD